MKRSLVTDRLAGRGAALVALAALAACGGGGNGDSASSTGSFASQSAAVVETAAWVDVATEYQPFTVEGVQVVRFGSGSRWVEKSISGASYCGVGTFGTDPAVGVAKTCQVQSATAAAASGSADSGQWVKVASQFATFVLASPQTVRFGQGTRWVEKGFSGTGYCAVSSFGFDPAPGVDKECQVLQGRAGTGPVPSSPVITRYSADAGRATISWALPARLADNTPVNALTALTVYHGPTQGQQGPAGAGTTAITNVPLSASQFTLNLPAGTRWIAMTATNAAGESSSSPEIKVSVR